VGKLEGKVPLGRLGRKWEDNIKLGLQKVGLAGMDWVELALDKDRWRDTCECGNELTVSIK
jgi:hypothetical protein